MTNKLPNVFANPLEKEIKNSQEVYYSQDRVLNNNTDIDVFTKINHIFNSKNHVYKSLVKITLKDSIIESQIVGKTSNYLLTLNGDKILISDILDIEKI